MSLLFGIFAIQLILTLKINTLLCSSSDKTAAKHLGGGKNRFCVPVEIS